MQCEEITIELDAFMTGELDAGRSDEIQRHIQQCPGCRAELEVVRKENALYQEYASVIDISAPELVNIRVESARPMAGGKRSVVHWWAWAVAAIVLLVAGLPWLFYARRGTPEITGLGVIDQSAEISPPVHRAVNDYEHAFALLQISYEGKKKTLNSNLVRDLDRNLEVTRRAIAECRKALKENPNNDQAVEFLLLDYEKQVGILRQITEE
jgi:hypothetical protein